MEEPQGLREWSADDAMQELRHNSLGMDTFGFVDLELASLAMLFWEL